MSDAKVQNQLFVQNRYLHTLLTKFEAMGVDCSALLARHNLSWRQIQADTPISLSAYNAIICDIPLHTDIVALGLKAGQSFKVQELGLLGYTLMSCNNLAKAFNLAKKYSLLMAPSTSQLNVSGDQAQFIFESQDAALPEQVLRFYAEFEFACWFEMASQWAEPQPWYQEVHFSFPQPAYARDYESYFQCPVAFNQPLNQVIFSARYLNLPFTGFNEQVLTLTEEKCASLLNEMLDNQSVTDQVKALLSRYSGQFPSSKDISSILGMSPATFRRRLDNEGTNYKQLLKEFRLQLACKHLLETQESVTAISDIAGYSDRANFIRAFKRFYAQSPGEYRAAHQRDF